MRVRSAIQATAKSVVGLSRAVRQSIPRDPASRNRMWNDTRKDFQINWKAVRTDLDGAISRGRRALKGLFSTNVTEPARSAALIARIKGLYPEAGDPAGQFLTLCVHQTLAADFVSIYRFKRLAEIATALLIWALVITGLVLMSISAQPTPNELSETIKHNNWSEAAFFSWLSCTGWSLLCLNMWTLGLELGVTALGLSFIISGLIPRALIAASRWNPRTGEEVALFGVSHGVFFCSLVLIIVFLLGVAREALEREYIVRLRRKRPVAHFLYHLFCALEVVPQSFAPIVFWGFPSLGESLILELEEAAGCVEFIPRIPSLRDPNLALWNKIAYRQRATGIRSLRKWVLVPKADTSQSLEHELRRIIGRVAAGDLDALPSADQDPLSVLPWWIIAFRVLRGLAIVIVPPLILIGLNRWLQLKPGFKWLQLKPELVSYMVPIALLWVLVSVLAILDPRFADKLSLVKSVQGIFGSGSKGKD